MTTAGAPPPKSVTVYEGRTFTEALTFVNADGDALDVSGFTWPAPQLRDVPDGALIATLAIDDSNAAGGVIVVTISATAATGWLDGSGNSTLTAVFDVNCESGGNSYCVGVFNCTLQQQVSVL